MVEHVSGEQDNASRVAEQTKEYVLHIFAREVDANEEKDS